MSRLRFESIEEEVVKMTDEIDSSIRDNCRRRLGEGGGNKLLKEEKRNKFI